MLLGVGDLSLEPLRYNDAWLEAYPNGRQWNGMAPSLLHRECADQLVAMLPVARPDAREERDVRLHVGGPCCLVVAILEPRSNSTAL